VVIPRAHGGPSRGGTGHRDGRLEVPPFQRAARLCSLPVEFSATASRILTRFSPSSRNGYARMLYGYVRVACPFPTAIDKRIDSAGGVKYAMEELRRARGTSARNPKAEHGCLEARNAEAEHGCLEAPSCGTDFRGYHQLD